MFFWLYTGSLVQHYEHITFGQKKPLLFGILKSLDLLDSSGLIKLQVIRTWLSSVLFLEPRHVLILNSFFQNKPKRNY